MSQGVLAPPPPSLPTAFQREREALSPPVELSSIMPATHFHLILQVKKGRSCYCAPRPKPFSDPITVYLLTPQLYVLLTGLYPLITDAHSCLSTAFSLLQYSSVKHSSIPHSIYTVYILSPQFNIDYLYFVLFKCAIHSFFSCKVNSKISFFYSVCLEGKVVLVLGSLLHCAEVKW
jgi:hypothetical protein